MKKEMIAILLLMVLALPASAHAMAKKQPVETWGGCINRPYTECAQFGSPMLRTWPAETINTRTGERIANQVPRPVTFVDYNEAAWMACASPIYDYCNTKLNR